MSTQKRKQLRAIMNRAWYLVRTTGKTLKLALYHAWQEAKNLRKSLGGRHVADALSPEHYRPTSEEFLAWFFTRLRKEFLGVRGQVVITPAMSNALRGVSL